MLQFTIRLIPVSLLLLPNSLLNVVGINYMGTGGSILGKLHPSFYVSGIALCLTFLLNNSARTMIPAWIKDSFRLPLAAAFVATFVALVLSRSGTGDVSAAVVTFLTPALIAYVLQFASEGSKRFFNSFIVVFFLINSLIGLAELGSSWRLLPYYVGDQIITFDRRPTSILGHPLLNALLTGVFLLSMITRQITHGLRTSHLPQMALHAAALFAFGGRASLALVIMITGLYALRHSGLFVRTKIQQSARSMSLMLFGAIFLAILTALGVTETLFDRFVNATDSTNTRFAAFELLQMLTLEEWLIGVEGQVRAFYLMVLNTPYGIEISPIAMTYVYGLPIALALLVSTYRLLFRWARTSFPGARYVVVFFILSTVTSLSIGSKSLLISQMLIVLFALRASTVPTSETRLRRQLASKHPLVSPTTHRNQPKSLSP